jgi:hypothetical protein
MVNVAQDIVTDMNDRPILDMIHRSLEDFVIGICKAIGEVVTLPRSPYDDNTLFSKPRQDMTHSRKRSVVCFEPIPLEFVKTIKRAAGVSLNDVLYTSVS